MSFDLKVENNDLSLNIDGTLKTVYNNYKLAQDIVKAVLTPTGSNRYFPWYGCVIGARVIGCVLDPSMMQIEAEQSVRNTLSNLISLQRSQARGQYVSAGETLAEILNISALRNPEDPRQFQIVVSALTRQLTIVEETFNLRF